MSLYAITSESNENLDGEAAVIANKSNRLFGDNGVKTIFEAHPTSRTLLLGWPQLFFANGQLFAGSCANAAAVILLEQRPQATLALGVDEMSVFDFYIANGVIL